ncbi:plasmid replication protein, CyRepA1 family [Pseudomonas farris]
MTNVQKGTGLEAFYEERFNSDPHSLLDFFDADIAAAAADAFVNWSSISGLVRLNGERFKAYSKAKILTTDSRYDGKVMVWGELKKTDPKPATDDRPALAAIEYPALTFSNNAASPSYWSGFTALLDLYQREKGIDTSERDREFLAKQEAKRVEREARQAAEEAAQRIRQERIQSEFSAYEKAWLTGERGEFEYEGTRKDRSSFIARGFVEVIGDEDGSAPYLQKKQIGAIASRFKMKRMRDSHGVFTAVPLLNIHGQLLGLQRLYDDKKLQGTGVKMDGAHCIFGDIETAEIRISVEGFATGASVYLAELEAGRNVAVVVAFNVDNLVKVLRIYDKFYPGWRFLNAADNDQWKDAGNAGMLAALEIHRDLQHVATVPTFESMSLDELAKAKETGKGPTDWNDYHCRYGLKSTAKALHARDSMHRAEKDWFSYCLQRLAHSGGKDRVEKAAKMAVNAGLLLVPIKYSVDEVVSRVIENLHPSTPVALHAKMRSLAHWICRQKVNQAQQLRGFSVKALANPNVRYMKIEGVRAEHGGIELPAHMADLVESLEGVIVVRAPMGSGKTEKLIAPLMKASTKAAYIAHRISLLEDAAARLNVEHYQLVTARQMPWVSHMACCVNSLTAPKFYNAEERSWFTTLETLCIDEASQVIRHTTTGPVEGRVRVLDSLIEAVAAAKRVLLCDADANDGVIEFCEIARPGEVITVLDIVGTTDHIRVDHGDDETVWQLAINQICTGRRVLVANDSAESAKKMAALIEEKIREEEIAPVRMLLVHADSKADPDVEEFLRNPNEEALKYDVLIYSPAISSGVSMTTPHFEHHFGLFSGNTVGPSDAVQMLRRDRTARHYVVGIGHTSGQRETDPESLYRGLLVAEDLVCQFQETPEEFRLTRKKTAFDKIWLSTVTSENKARNSFANNLLLMLSGEGYQVQRLAIDPQTIDDLTDMSRKNRKFAGELVFAKRMDLIDSVETPTEEAFLKLNRQEVRSEAESAQVDRYHIEHQLGVDEINPDDVAFYDDRGIAKVVQLELLQADESQAKAYDMAQRKARVVITQHRFKTPAHTLLKQIFEILKLDRFSGVGEFNSLQCRQVLELLKRDQATLDLYNALKLGRHLASLNAKACATTVVKSILERLGLTTNKRKTNGQVLFGLNMDNWAFVMGYVQRRAAKNIHSLTTHDHEATHQPLLAPEELAEAPKAQHAPATAGAASSDTSQLEGVSTVEKYPLEVAERVFAFASLCELPAGTPVVQLMREIDPGVVRRMANPGEEFKVLKWMLGYAAKLLRPQPRYTV